MIEKIQMFFLTWKMILLGLFFEGELFSGFRESKRREEICFKCPKRDKTLNVCNECGCFIKIKSKFKNATCPLGEWKGE